MVSKAFERSTYIPKVTSFDGKSLEFAIQSTNGSIDFIDYISGFNVPFKIRMSL